MFCIFRMSYALFSANEWLAEVIDKTDILIGKDYQVLTIGFNTEEPLSRLFEKRELCKTHENQGGSRWVEIFRFR